MRGGQNKTTQAASVYRRFWIKLNRPTIESIRETFNNLEISFIDFNLFFPLVIFQTLLILIKVSVVS